MKPCFLVVLHGQNVFEAFSRVIRLIFLGEFMSPKRPLEDQVSEDNSSEKRQCTDAQGQAIPHSGETGYFSKIPNELRFAIAEDVAGLPNRQDALSGLTTLRNSRYMREVILGSVSLRQKIDVLQRYPGIESRHLAVCFDVVHGDSIEEAVSKNGPLPREDKDLKIDDFHKALNDASPEHLAVLAQAFGAQNDAAARKALTGLASVIDRERLDTGSVADLGILAQVFTTNGKEMEKGVLTGAMEQISHHAFQRRFEIFERSNISEMAAFTAAYNRYPEDENARLFVETLASHVNTQGHALLSHATDEQLATLKTAFSDVIDDDDCQRGALSVQTEQVRRVELTRSQLDHRDRSHSADR